MSKKKTYELRNLHKLLYDRPGTVSLLKKNVGQFSGFPFEKGSIQYKKKEEMLKKFRNAMLKSICEVLDLERSGVNSELVKRILNFLMHPKPSGKVRINFYYFSNKSILFSLSFLSFFLMNILIVSSIAVNIQ